VRSNCVERIRIEEPQFWTEFGLRRKSVPQADAELNMTEAGAVQVRLAVRLAGPSPWSSA
jgi:hypothetical protein